MEVSSAVTAALTGIKNATDIVKLIKESNTSLESAEIKLKLAELLEALAEAKIEIANIKGTLVDNEVEISQLKSQLDTKSNIVWEDPYYFIPQKNSDNDGPFCQKCYDSNNMLIRLQSPGKNGYWKCEECKTSFTDKNYKEDDFGIISMSKTSEIDWDTY